MIAVIQCAGSKRKGTGYFATPSGERVVFVARPEIAPQSERYLPVHPDAPTPNGHTWRDEVLAYNQRADNPLHLHAAWELYEPTAYRRLVSHLGVENVYVLSAGWGLVRSDFKLPQYDITFTSAVKKKRPWVHRRRSDIYRDFGHLPAETTEEVYFFGGKDYLGLFSHLTRHIRGPRTAFFNSALPPKAPGLRLQRFEATRNMNWHYDCVDWFVST
jgi:hypothetical protein